MCPKLTFWTHPLSFLLPQPHVRLLQPQLMPWYGVGGIDPDSPAQIGRGSAVIRAGIEPVQLSFFELEDPKLAKLKKELLDIDLNRLTPLEAHNKLSSLQSAILSED